jgi:hypothetical protein
MGVGMSGMLLYWTKGNKTYYTRSLKIAEEAMREGHFVMVLRKKPHILKNLNT